MVASRGLSFTSLWYKFKNACLRAVLRLKDPPSDPRQVLVGAGVHAYPVAGVDEERHLHDDPRLQGRRFVSARGRVALESRVRFGDLEVDVRRRLYADDLPVGRQDVDGATLDDVSGRLADYFLWHGYLLVGVGVHKIEKVSVL